MTKSSPGFISVPILVIILALILSAGAYFVGTESQLQEHPGGIACTMEAKQCPDGSYVGRTGPACEFTPCSQNETAGWKTYRNEKYNYSISYPVSYTPQISGKTDCFDARPDTDGPIFCVSPHENPKNLSSREWWNTQEEGSSSLVETHSILVAGQQALVFESKPDSFPMTNIVFAYGGKIFVIDSNTPYENEMLNSFKFIPPTATSVDTSTWKTYRNEQYGFEVKYPVEWLAQEGEGKIIVGFIAPQGIHSAGDINVGFYNSPPPGISGSQSLFAGKKASVVEWRSVVPVGLMKEVFVLENPTLYFTIRAVSGDSQNATKILEDKILSTFKFIPPTENQSSQIISPSQGDRWTIGKTYSIRWLGGQPSSTSTVTLRLLSLTSGGPCPSGFGMPCIASLLYTIADLISNTGSYQWTIPPDFAVDQWSRVKIIMWVNGSDITSQEFSIVSPPRSTSQFPVTSPAQGDTWLTGHSYTIFWQSPPSPLGKAFETVTLSLAPPRPACLDATPRCMIAEVAPYVIADEIINKGTYEWKIPADLAPRYLGNQQITVTIRETDTQARSGLFTIQGASAAVPPQSQPPVELVPKAY